MTTAPSSRRRSAIPSSSAAPSDIATPSSRSQVRLEPEVQFLDGVREESEKEDDAGTDRKSTGKVKTPRRSGGEESGYSDYNPFQSGSEEAAQRERRRRKVSRVCTWNLADIRSRQLGQHPELDLLNLGNRSLLPVYSQRRVPVPNR
jgi:hypothetical protein